MAGESTPGCVHIPFYATGFRGDRLAAALADIAAVAPRYGATHYDVYRSRDDMYRFLLVVEFSSKLDWERYWSGQKEPAELYWELLNDSGLTMAPLEQG
jgi:hypothetical protein